MVSNSWVLVMPGWSLRGKTRFAGRWIVADSATAMLMVDEGAIGWQSDNLGVDAREPLVLAGLGWAVTKVACDNIVVGHLSSLSSTSDM